MFDYQRQLRGEDSCKACKGPSRRDFLKVGALSTLGLTLGDYFMLQDAAAQAAVPSDVLVSGPAPITKAQSVIFIYMSGGMSHMDSFDPKPYAPIEYRGELGTVNTNTGDVFSGQLGRLAAVADKMAVIRSVTHGEAAHERGSHNMITGFKPSPAITYPSYGSVVSHHFGSRNDLPGYIAVPAADIPDMGTGYLSSAFGAFSVGGEPQDPNFRVRDLNLPAGVTPERMEGRRNLLQAVDAHFNALEKSDALTAMNSYYERAYSLISSQKAREAFDITQEAAEMRDMYGRHNFGQRLLLSRRLVEAGARFVSVSDGGWDHHKNIKGAMSGQLPYVDQGLAALLTDLSNRGLLESTLVVLTTEFGRTARLNQDGGRDHWPKVFSMVMAGGGIKGGVIHGMSDPRGAEPANDPVGPGDIGSTIYTLLGINPGDRIMSAGNRPIDITRDGKPISSIIA